MSDVTRINPSPSVAGADRRLPGGMFDSFPLPLALLRPDGGVRLTNLRCNEQYEAGTLEHGARGLVAAGAYGTWKLIEVRLRDGTSSQARAMLELHGDVLLMVLDEAQDPRTATRIDELHTRIAELERASSTDSLTGAWNRAHLDRVTEAEAARSRRFRQPVSLILLDIDHFKNVNDTLGHQTGDMVLCELVGVVGAAIRGGDLLFRWGGEEFVVLAPSTSYRQAEVLAEALRSKVVAHPFVAGSMTISVGVAELNGAESMSAWFVRVDAALYAAKRGGRNRVEVDRHGSSDAWSAGPGSLLRLVWQEAYQSGSELVDREHRELFDRTNEVIDAWYQREVNPALFEQAFEKLLGSVAAHFADEEALLARLGWDGLPAHARAHRNLLDRAQDMAIALREGKVGLGAILDYVANEVVIRHLDTYDRKFFPLLAQAARG